jgi:IS5 family transposase
MHQTKKGNQWHCGMKGNIGADAEAGLVHTVRGTAADFKDVVETNSLLDGDETYMFANADYPDADKRSWSSTRFASSSGSSGSPRCDTGA